MTAQASLWGDRNPWRADDPARCCYTCGHAPVGRYNDGSPRYPASCDHQPVYRPDAPQAATFDPLVITLRGKDLADAEACAQRIHARGQGRQDRQGVRSLDSTRKGYYGEMAFARISGLPFRCDIHGFGKPDVGRYQVRTSAGHPFLPVHENDRDDVPVVLMMGRPPGPFRLVGWIAQARLAKRRDYLDDPGGRRPAFFVPLDALDSPWTIPEVAARYAPGGVASAP